MSHAAIVAREFGIPRVVDAHDATRRLRDAALFEVDGATGQLHVLELADPNDGPDCPTDDRGAAGDDQQS